MYYPPNSHSKVMMLIPISPEHRSLDEEGTHSLLPDANDASAVEEPEQNEDYEETNSDASPAKRQYENIPIDVNDDNIQPYMKMQNMKEEKSSRDDKSEASEGGESTKKYASKDDSYADGSGSYHESNFRKKKGDEGKKKYLKESKYKRGKKKSYGRKFGDEKKKKEKFNIEVEPKNDDEETEHEEKSAPAKSEKSVSQSEKRVEKTETVDQPKQVDDKPSTIDEPSGINE